MHVSELHIYPIKSCGGTAVTSAQLSKRGLQADRLLMLVDEEGVFITQREAPRLALVQPTLTPTATGHLLQAVAPGMAELEVEVDDHGVRDTVVVWRDTCTGVDQGDVAAEWFGNYLGGGRVRLVRMANEFARRLDPAYAISPHDETSFTDGYPVLLISQGSLDDLNGRLQVPLPMNRFRPNIVVTGCDAFAEDGWRRIRIGEVELALVKPCARCTVTTTDQATAVVGKEPLVTLATYRRVNNKVMFGQNLIGLGRGTMHVGDEITVLE